MRGAYFQTMCGRYACELTDQELFDMFRVPNQATLFPGFQFDVKPGTPVPTVRVGKDGLRGIVGLKWMWTHGKFSHCNAKGENVRRYPAYRESFARRRCLVPATGYYEWMKVTPKVKQRYYIERKDGKPLAFAGLYSHDDGMMATITCAPNAEIAQIHDRLPVFIEEADWERYLDPEPLTDIEKHRMIAPPPDGFFRYWPVANQATGRDLKREIKMMPLSEAPAPPQGDLFGKT